jgi:glycosyltransferase involved in cell wall biosynthesis
VSEPRVTALLPVRRYHRAYLERAVESVLSQTSPSWRLLVVYDDVGDELREVLGSVFEDVRVGLVPNEGRRLAGALNTGMRRAGTEFTAILLGDDVWAPEAVEVLDSYIERFPDVDFFHSSRAVIDEHDRRISSVYPARESFTLESFAGGSPVKHLLCWRREKGLAIGGLDETLDSVGPDDYDFPWSMAESGARFMAVPECLYLYRDHRDGFRLTTHLPRSTHTRALRRIMRKHGVGRLRTEYVVAAAKRGYLRQCLYRSRLDRRLKELRGHETHDGWRLPWR